MKKIILLFLTFTTLSSFAAIPDSCLSSIAKARIILNDNRSIESVLNKTEGDLSKLLETTGNYVVDVQVFYRNESLENRLKLRSGVEQIISEYANCQMALLND